MRVLRRRLLHIASSLLDMVKFELLLLAKVNKGAVCLLIVFRDNCSLRYVFLIVLLVLIQLAGDKLLNVIVMNSLFNSTLQLYIVINQQSYII